MVNNDIAASLTNIPSWRQGGINEQVSNIKGEEVVRPFSIGFKYFNDKYCVLKTVNPKNSRKLQEIYRNIGKCYSQIQVRELPHDIKSISNTGHYRKYFSKVTEDTDVHEFDIGDCRGFFFFDNINNIVQMLAVDHHPEDKKNKRK